MRHTYFRVLNISFGAGECCGHVPCNLGSDMQIVEAHDGVHVYLGCPSWAVGTAPEQWIKTAETATFRNQILASTAAQSADAACTSAAVWSSASPASILPARKGAVSTNLRHLRVQVEHMHNRAATEVSSDVPMVPKSNAFCASNGKPYHQVVRNAYDAEVSTTLK
jgi:hypothetical protein